MEQDVRMRFDEAGEQRQAGQVDDFGVARHGDLGRRPDGLDAVATDEDHLAFPHQRTDAVEYAGRSQHYRTRRRSRGALGTSSNDHTEQRAQSQQQRRPGEAHHALRALAETDGSPSADSATGRAISATPPETMNAMTPA